MKIAALVVSVVLTVVEGAVTVEVAVAVHSDCYYPEIKSAQSC